MEPSIAHHVTVEEGGPAAMEGDDHGCLSAFIDTGSAESHRLYLARRTVLEMLRDRGYGIAVTDLEQNLATFRSLYGENPDLERLKISSVLLRDPSKKVLVIFCGTSPVKLSTVRDLAMQYGKENLSRMILVLQSNMTSKSQESMKLLFPFKVQTFHEIGTDLQKVAISLTASPINKITDLLINITKHVLKPHHEALTAAEKEKLLKKYNVQESQLPRMLESDAVAQYYGFEKGTVLRITYEGELTKNHVTYRCVM